MKRFRILALLLPMLWAAGCENDEHGEAPYFESDYSAENPIRFEPQGEAADKTQEVRVVVRSNISWTVTSDAEEWCTVYPAAGKDEGRFYVTAQMQDQPYPRSCTLTARDGGGNVVATIPVNQGAPAKRLEIGEQEITASADGDDIFITVDTNVDWGAELVDAADAAWVTLGTPDLSTGKLSVSVTPYSGDRQARIRIYALDEPSLEQTVTLIQTSVLTLPDFTTLDAVPHNTLVTLRNVNFAVPLGTLYNLTLAGFECDLTIRDGKGNAFTVRTRESDGFKHAQNVLFGDYNLTGSIDRSGPTPALRLRSEADMVKIAAESYRSIAEWYGDKSAVSDTGWSVAKGSGTAAFGVKINSAGADVKSSFARKDCTKAYAADNTYWGPSLKSWNGSAQYYKFTVSTAGISEDIYLSLWTLSFSSSVAELKVEWAESPDATTWTDCGVVLTQNNAANGTSNEYFLGTYSVHVPGAQNRETVCFRVSKASDKRADSKTSVISATGPNYMCYFGVFALNE